MYLLPTDTCWDIVLNKDNDPSLALNNKYVGWSNFKPIFD